MCFSSCFRRRLLQAKTAGHVALSLHAYVFLSLGERGVLAPDWDETDEVVVFRRRGGMSESSWGGRIPLVGERINSLENDAALCRVPGRVEVPSLNGPVDDGGK